MAKSYVIYKQHRCLIKTSLCYSYLYQLDEKGNEIHLITFAKGETDEEAELNLRKLIKNDSSNSSK